MIGLPDWALYIDDYYLKHMRGLKVFDVSLIICLLLVGCQSRVTRQQDADYMLAEMRSDTAYIHELDSLATLALGSDANCIDPVWHLFNCNGRRWFHNPDWGGVLEIPEGWYLKMTTSRRNSHFMAHRLQLMTIS